MSYNKNGVVLFEGPSVLDGSPITVIATGLRRTTNKKVGASMIQVWILRQDRSPTVAVKDGSDAAICGDCKRRPSQGGDCYVVAFRGPLPVWKSWKAGRYQTWDGADTALFTDRIVRFGAYGDPAAVPARVFRPIRKSARGWTSYTHQWRMPSARHLRAWTMASVDTEAEATEAQAMGWRTFRARHALEKILKREITCPAAKEAPTFGRMTCDACRLCDGVERGVKRPNVVIVAHGARSPRTKVA